MVPSPCVRSGKDSGNGLLVLAQISMSVSMPPMIMLLIMRAQCVAAEVALQITPHAVDVVGVVLSVVVLDEHSRSMHPIVVRLA